MAEPWLSFPVTCPQCEAEELCNLPIATLAAALLQGTAIELHVHCHDLRWDADRVEVEQLREYLSSVRGICVERASPPKVSPQVLTR